MTNVEPAILTILEESAIVDGNLIRLNCGQLERKTYEAVNNVLERLGGKWNRKVRAHIFSGDPAPLLTTVIETGEMPPKNPTAYFPTPTPVVSLMVQRGDIQFTHSVLEPSAGQGAIVEGLPPHASLTLYELLPANCAVLRTKGYAVEECDFLTVQEGSFDRVLMNPPFTAPGDPLAYIAHIRRAWLLLAPGGRLVAIAPTGFIGRLDRRCAEFRLLVAQFGGWEVLPQDSFKDSGTGVNTVLIWMQWRLDDAIAE